MCEFSDTLLAKEQDGQDGATWSACPYLAGRLFLRVLGNIHHATWGEKEHRRVLWKSAITVENHPRGSSDFVQPGGASGDMDDHDMLSGESRAASVRAISSVSAICHDGGLYKIDTTDWGHSSST